jgi:hypothetical protein
MAGTCISQKVELLYAMVFQEKAVQMRNQNKENRRRPQRNRNSDVLTRFHAYPANLSPAYVSARLQLERPQH